MLNIMDGLRPVCRAAYAAEETKNRRRALTATVPRD
jgi:hypothetical protein